MRTYHHLSLEEREKLYGGKEKGWSLRRIALNLGRNHSSLSRELKRNTRYGRLYIPCQAQTQAERIGRKQRSKAPLKNPKVFLYVRQKLRKRWSPQTIAGRLCRDHPEERVHPETIYRYIYNSKKTRGMKLWRYLTCHRKRRMKQNGRKVKEYGKLKDALPIDQRPQEVNQRLKPGDWESDNMEGKKSDRTSLSVTVDRQTRVARLKKLDDHKAQTKSKAVIVQMQKEEEWLRGSLTVDRGPENSDHKRITYETGMLVFACHPYHSWEKGTVENTIGRIRRYVPKGLSLDLIPKEYFEGLEEELNHTPRKCLGYLTPYEKMKEVLKIRKEV